MKGKNAVRTIRKDSSAAVALSQARDHVRAVKKRVKDAKAVLKAAREDLKLAKKSRKAAEARREAEMTKRAPRRASAAGSARSASKAEPRAKIVAVRLRRRTATQAQVSIPELPLEHESPGMDPAHAQASLA